ncbi:MAG: cysteine synthase A [Planctomycetes bacterium]|nr:cysteine synthase A [Planctomycetota bacterium]
MTNRHDRLHEIVGHTPVVRLDHLIEPGMATIWAKLESQNPAASVKDRAARLMIEAAEERGELRRGMTVVEATSGNMGIGLAMIAASKGYACILAMPETMTVERRRLLLAYGAQVVLTPGKLGMGGAISEAATIAKHLGSKAWLARQFDNPDNPRAHYLTTGPEIYQQVPEVDVFVAAVGTGGTISGAGRYLKERKPEIEVVAVEPSESPVLSGGRPAPHEIQGIGVGFVPATLDRNSYDRVGTASYHEALIMARRLGRKEGILSGISTGAILHVAIQEARELGPEGNLVFIVCDYGERYASHELWSATP